MAVASAGPYANLHLAPQITTPASHHSVFYRPDALPAALLNNSTPDERSSHNNSKLLCNDRPVVKWSAKGKGRSVAERRSNKVVWYGKGCSLSQWRSNEVGWYCKGCSLSQWAEEWIGAVPCQENFKSYPWKRCILLHSRTNSRPSFGASETLTWVGLKRSEVAQLPLPLHSL